MNELLHDRVFTAAREHDRDIGAWIRRSPEGYRRRRVDMILTRHLIKNESANVVILPRPEAQNVDEPSRAFGRERQRMIGVPVRG